MTRKFLSSHLSPSQLREIGLENESAHRLVALREAELASLEGDMVTFLTSLVAEEEASSLADLLFRQASHQNVCSRGMYFGFLSFLKRQRGLAGGWGRVEGRAWPLANSVSFVLFRWSSLIKPRERRRRRGAGYPCQFLFCSIIGSKATTRRGMECLKPPKVRTLDKSTQMELPHISEESASFFPFVFYLNSSKFTPTTYLACHGSRYPRPPPRILNPTRMRNISSIYLNDVS